MSTFYTSGLGDGEDVTFSDFVMGCAGAFDESDESEADKYHDYVTQLEKAKADLARIEKWDDVEADRQAQLAYDRALRERKEWLIELSAKRERYEVMLAQVEVWTPPTPEHEALKSFMINQLERSIASDCKTNGVSDFVCLSGAAYKEDQLYCARRYVAYYADYAEAAKKRAEEHVKWMAALRQSLAEPSGTP